MLTDINGLPIAVSVHQRPAAARLARRLDPWAEAAVSAEPGEGPLDTPQRLEPDEPVGPRGTSPDVDRDAEFFTGTCDQADICGVGEHLGELGELRFRGFRGDYEATVTSSQTFVHVAAVAFMLNRLHSNR